jgi:superfamily II DNA or RNA helicase
MPCIKFNEFDASFYVYFLHCIDLRKCSNEGMNFIKIGSCTNWKDRRGGYITCMPYNEPTLDYLILCNVSNMINIEVILQNYYKQFNTKNSPNHNGGGTEWFNFDKLPSVVEIKNILLEYGFGNEIKSGDELDTYVKDMTRTIKETNNEEENEKEKIMEKLEYHKKKLNDERFPKRDYQLHVYNNAIEEYKTENNLILNWACGLGKTIESLWISTNYVNQRLLIGLPSIILIKQWINTIKKISYYDDFKYLIVSSDKTIKNTDNIHITSKVKYIEKYLANNNNVILLTTYHSSYKLLNYKFDFGIFDECHHLCGLCDLTEHKETDAGKFTDILKVECSKTMSLTATLKELQGNFIDNFDEKTFGKILDIKTFNWAIVNKYITDYRFITLRMMYKDIIQLMDTLKIDNKKHVELFLSAYMSISQAIMNYDKIDKISHILIYCNSVENANIVTDFINQIIERKYINFTDIYNETLSSKKSFDLDSEMIQFKNSSIGIISCIYIFGEGFDKNYFNTCVIAENMQSTIRLVQSLMRANRLGYSGKIANYMCPFIDECNESELKSFKKLKLLLIEINKIDPDLIHKIKYICNEKKSKEEKELKEYNTVEFDELKTENIKILMRHRKVLYCKNWDENEFYYYRAICINNKISSKDSYNDSKLLFESEGLPFISDPKKYFTSRSTHIWKHWYDFFGTNIDKMPDTKEKLKKICLENKITSKTYKNLWQKYDLPEDPSLLFNEFNNLQNLLGERRKFRR